MNLSLASFILKSSQSCCKDPVASWDDFVCVITTPFHKDIPLLKLKNNLPSNFLCEVSKFLFLKESPIFATP